MRMTLHAYVSSFARDQLFHLHCNTYKQEKYPLSINTYRSNWVTDMANRTIDSPWNTLSRQDWLEGWRQMLTPGTYERESLVT